MPPAAETVGPRPWSRGMRVAVVLVVGVVVAAGAWAFTSSRTGVEAAPDGTNPACATLLAALPESLVGLPRTPQGSPGVAVWGDDGIVLRCGAEVLGPTEKPCLPIGPDADSSIDWVLDAQNDKAARFLTFGRNPAVEVTVDVRMTGTSVNAAPSTLVDLSTAVAAIPQTRTCL